MALKIEGTIEHEGKTYEAIDYRKADSDEHWLFGKAACKGKTTFETIILREVKPPHVYKVGDWVRVIGLSKDDRCNKEHPIGSVRQVTGVYSTWVDVQGLWILRNKNIEPCDPPAPKYRPFASAEEFEPHARRFIMRKDRDCERSWLVGYFAGDCVSLAGNIIEYKTLVDRYIFRDDGTPCGVLVTE